MSEENFVQLDHDLPDLLSEELELGKTIGAGGMGVVSRTEDRSLLRSMAVKSLRSGNRLDEVLRRRLLAEARLTAQLDHPNIVPVYRLGNSKNQGLYFTMKEVEGETLTELIRSTPLKLRSTEDLYGFLQVFLKVCDAVAFAHSRGIIHRDIKADNVMVGRFGQVYLMDWGIAKSLEAKAPPSSASLNYSSQGLTQDGMAVGTLNYMAPEQLSGGPVDRLTDVFALGGLLYEILTTTPPYPEIAASKLMEKVRRGLIEPPAARAGVSLPPRLCSIAMKALSPSPKERYQSVEELQKALTQFLQSGWQFPVRRYRAGAVIFREGDAGHAAYAIYSGRCRVLQGDEGRELRILKTGDVFGETAVFAKVQRTATIEAIDDVVLLEITRESFEEDLGMGFWIGLFVRALATRFIEKEKELQSSRQEKGSDSTRAED